MFNVAVIGGGVIGLTSALEIQKAFGSFAKITIYSKEFSPNTTADVAAGLICPFLSGNTPKDKVAVWFKATTDYLKGLWREGKAAGIALQPVVNLSSAADFDYPDWLQLTLGHTKLTEAQLNEWREQYRNLGQLTGGFVFVSFTWEANVFLPHLEKEFRTNGGTIRQKEIKTFDELYAYDAIVNCTGLGAESLVPDGTLYPIRGQIARVQAPWQFHTIITDRTPSTYIIPNVDYVILGGTKEKEWSLGIDTEERERFFSDCCTIVKSLRDCEIFQDAVGLRPGRAEVRLELEQRRINGKIVNIVHNYGHGGSGITWSVGCAKDVVEIMKNLQKNASKL